MSTNTIPKNALPIHFFTFLFVSSTVAWSFNFTSFNHAKELVFFGGVLSSGVFFLKPRLKYTSNLLIWCALLVIISYSFLRAFFAETSFTPETILAWTRVLFLFFFISLTCSVLKKKQIRDLITHWLIASSTIISILALTQKFGLISFLFPVVEGYTQPMYSVFGNQNLLGGYLAITMPLLLSKYFGTPTNKYLIGLIGLLLVALILSECRTAWLASGVGVAIVFYYHRKSTAKASYIIFGIFCLLCIVVPILSASTVQKIIQTGTAEDISFGLRQWIWAGSLTMWKDFAVSGTGLGNFAYYSPNYLGQILEYGRPERFTFNQIHTWHAHSDYLETLINFGLAGFLVIGVAIWSLIKIPKELKAPFVTLAIFSIFNTTLHSPPFAILWLLLIMYSFSENNTPLRASRRNLSLYAGTVCLGIVIAYSSVFPSFLLNRSRTYFDRDNDVTIAINSYKEASAYWGAPPETFMEWAILEMEMGRFERSLAILEEVKNRIDTGEWHYAMGISHEQTGDRSKAIEHYRKTVERWPRFKPAWEKLVFLIPEEEKPNVEYQFRTWVKDLK
jgi:O-antigen ligase